MFLDRRSDGSCDFSAGGACGYGDLGKSGYGMATAGLSEALFEKGAACGGCYEVRCVEELRYCLPGTSMVLTITNFCAPNYGLPADAGGICNPPNHHILMPIQAFEKIAIWKAGVMPIQYRRSLIYAFSLLLLPIAARPKRFLSKKKKKNFVAVGIRYLLLFFRY